MSTETVKDQLPGADQMPNQLPDREKELLPVHSYFDRDAIIAAISGISRSELAPAEKAARLGEIQARLLLDLRTLLIHASPYELTDLPYPEQEKKA